MSNHIINNTELNWTKVTNFAYIYTKITWKLWKIVLRKIKAILHKPNKEKTITIK